MQLADGFPLPDELIGLIFNLLDVPSVLRCTQVCKLFRSIILGDTKLIYKIELFASFMEDNEHSSMDVTSRLNLLRQYSRAWNNMEWSSFGTIPMCDGYCWEFSGGILAQSNRDNKVLLVRIPCTLKHIAEKRWTVPFDFEIRDFTLDSSQDLLVLLELDGTFPTMSFKLHLRTLSGDNHPCAAAAQISHAVAGLHAEFSFVIQICGNRLAVLCYHQLGVSPQSSFLVWNWKTGRQEVNVDTPAFRSFAFMTEDMILAAILRSDSKPALQVLAIAAFICPVRSLEVMPYICELQYPALEGCVKSFLIRSDPTPTLRPPASPGVPFYVSRKNFIFTISMGVFLDEINETTVLIVPLSTLLSEVERSRDVPRHNVVWDDWGPDGTRMIHREPSETWVCYTYGMKFIQGLWKNATLLYDFNPYAIPKGGKASVDSPILWNSLAKRQRRGRQYDSFDELITTTLPGRVASIKIPYSVEGRRAPMIGEDCILMVQPSSSTYSYMAI